MSSGVKSAIEFTFESASLYMVFFTNGTVWLEDVHAKEKRQGHGTKCLQLATAYADREGITLRLKARKYGQEPSPSDEQLVRMYQKHGFIVDSSYLDMKPIRMVRKPRTP